MPKPPLTAPAFPIALHKNHLLSPPPDRLTNTPTTLSITHIDKSEITIHQLRAHEPPTSPNQDLLYTSTHQWPGPRTISTSSPNPILILKRSPLRKWSAKEPATGKEVLEASPYGKGCRLNIRFRNALHGISSDPPPYEVSESEIIEKGAAADGLPGYSAGSALRELLNAIEPPVPAPAGFLSGSLGETVELKVVLMGSGLGVMLGRQMVMHISRHNSMDYSKSKARLKPRWEVEVAEGVDLLLAVVVVLVMMEVG